ncbi:FliM/FliN family flagellar motor switch protein [Myxococcota bacterium]|nr:FliM/FliN family flagellar motor switch protein [Myxococcota bacterium]
MLNEQTDEPTVSVLQPESATPDSGNGEELFGRNLELIRGVKVRLSVVMGECEMSVGELFDLKDGSVVKLDRDVDAPVDVLLDGKVVGRGTLVAVDDNFGVRITEVESD